MIVKFKQKIQLCINSINITKYLVFPSLAMRIIIELICDY